jgi:NADPH:quinone reductase-like Zn-dependent oxidoreductase
MNHEELLKRVAGLSPAQKEALLKRLGFSGAKSGGELKPDPGDMLPASACFACDPGTPGSLSITFREAPTESPPAGYVQVKAKAASLNYRDLMIAMGQYPEAPGVPSNMGSDYSGIVTAVGDGVTEFKTGDEVMALSAGTFIDGIVEPGSHFISIFNVNRLQLVRKPGILDFNQSATLPTVFLTAFSALVRLGSIREGESVLIHTATGGVGLAALEIARWKKARIFATAGSPEKREFLASKGIETPMDSRTTEFGDVIMNMTGGKGVDLVLNTLSGDAMLKGLEILSPFGRFIQVDKKDIAMNTLLPMGLFRNGITFSVLDISLYLLQPAMLAEQLQEICRLYEEGVFAPLPLHTWPITRLKEALTAMSRSKHIGKLVITYP